MAQEKEKLVLDVVVPENIVTTENLANTTQYLEDRLPSVLETQCFNPDNLTFKDEVKNTEIAHLLEHILIDLFCEEKVKLGAGDTYCKGVTTWDWNKNEVGTFKVELSISKEDQHVMYLIFPRALELMEELVSKS